MFVFTLTLSSIVYLLGVLGSLPDPFASPIWPATGFQVAMYFRYGTKSLVAMTPGLLIVQIQNGILGGMSYPIAVGFALVSISAMITEAWVARYFAFIKGKSFHSKSVFLRFALFSMPLAAATSAVQGVSYLHWAGSYPDDISYYYPYFVWFSGNLIGAFIIVPIMTLSKSKWQAFKSGWQGACVHAVISMIIVALLVWMPDKFQPLFILALLVNAYVLCQKQNYSVAIVVSAFTTLLIVVLQVTDYVVIEITGNGLNLLYLQASLAIALIGITSFSASFTENRQLSEQLKQLNKDLQAQVLKRTEELRASKEEAERLARIDPLTELTNRRGFHTDFQAVTKLARRQQFSIGIIIIDIDDFKKVNDEFGHDFGDHVLVTLAKTLKQKVRESDILARFGGEEFIIALPNTHLSELTISAERIRSTIAESLHKPNSKSAITVSIGAMLASHEQGFNFDDMFKKADQALYQAKSQGKNQVVVA